MSWLELHWRHPEFIHLLWLVAAMVGLLVALELRSRDALGRFLSPLMQHRLSHSQSGAWRLGRLALVAISLGAGVLAIMGPESKAESETVSSSQISADIMIVLDVSRSMLAEDAAPNRLARAKAEISGMLNQMPGHRLGLVAFAGRASVLCPLTPDYAFFRMILRSANPKSITRGGTKLGDAIRVATRAFGSEPGARLLLLITDGEDHDSFPLDAAAKAVDAGVRIVAVGFGSEDGSKIAITAAETGARSFVTDNSGQVVTSRLDGKLLREIAEASEGAYIPAGVAALDLESIVSEHIEPMAREATVTTTRLRPRKHYPWFVLASLVTIFASIWMAATPGRRQG